MEINQTVSDDSSEGTRAATSFLVTSAGGSFAVVTPGSGDSVRPKSRTSDNRQLTAIEEVVISSRQSSARKPKGRTMYTKRFLNAIHAEEEAAGKPLTRVDPSNIVEGPVEEKVKGTVMYSERFMKAVRGEMKAAGKYSMTVESNESVTVPKVEKPKGKTTYMYTKRLLNAIHAEKEAAGKPLTKVDPSHIVEDPVEEKHRGTVVYSEKFLRALRAENETTANRTAEPVVTVEDEPEGNNGFDRVNLTKFGRPYYPLRNTLICTLGCLLAV